MSGGSWTVRDLDECVRLIEEEEVCPVLVVTDVGMAFYAVAPSENSELKSADQDTRAEAMLRCIYICGLHTERDR